MNAQNRVIQRTDHPHIVKINGVCGGAAIIEGTRIAVWHIVEYYYKVGMSVEEFLLEWSYLKPAQVFDALAYYHDHREEIDKLRRENSYEYWKEHYEKHYEDVAA
ncbi:MAG: DUF433 domain-containing protein, partial [Gammaproteobacteria bacterium]